MVFWGVLELIGAAFIILLFSTQVFIPLWNGTKLFPAIGRRKLNAQMKEVKEELEKEGEMQDLDQLERDLEKLKENREENKENEGIRQQQSPKVGSGEDQKGS